MMNNEQGMLKLVQNPDFNIQHSLLNIQYSS
jgi:hypothetical protein